MMGDSSAADRLLQNLALPAPEHTDRVALYTAGGRVQRHDDGAVLVVDPGGTASLGTYFNAFPAAYWSRWTPSRSVTLEVVAAGPGRITVWRSDAAGAAWTVERVRVETVPVDADAVTRLELPLDRFPDGGLYWFDVTAEAGPVQVRSARWLAADAVPPGRATVAVTTVGRAEFVLPLLRTLSASPAVAEVVDRIVVVDQSAAPLTEHPDVAALLAADPRLRVLPQANLGGSGGFSRGMLEALAAGSDFVLLLDDDVEVDPESIRRAVVFASRCTAATIVGAQMLDLNAPTVLHSAAETVTRRDFMWRSLTPSRHDLAVGDLRETPFLHRRWEAGYNGWWMCLIPTRVLQQVGLSLPLFIKWDDAEYGLRAAAAGIPTVTLPGCAIWHVAWVDKNDSRDWQAFYHARNRLVTALLHSGTRHGGTLLLQNLALDVRYLLTMDYSTVALRHAAYESALDGPDALPGELGLRLDRLRRLRSGFLDAAAVTSVPAGVRRIVARASAERPAPLRAALLAGRRLLRHAVVPASAAPPVAVPAGSARWWTVSTLDSVYVQSADRAHWTLHRRRPRDFRRGLAASLLLAVRLWRAWPRLHDRYSQKLPEIASPGTWRRLTAGD